MMPSTPPTFRVGLALGIAVVCACSKPKPSQEGDAGASPGPLTSASAVPGLTASLSLLNGFEGEIDGFVKHAREADVSTAVTLFVKGDRVRLDLPEKLARSATGAPALGAPTYAVLDATNRRLSLVSDPRKQVMLFDMNKAGEALSAMGGAPSVRPPSPPAAQPASAPKTTLTKTGRTESVAGYRCEDWEVASDHREATLCVAEQGVSWLQFPLTGVPTERLWMAELLDGKHFPLRAVSFAKDGTTEESRVEVTRIEKKSLAPSQFEPPASYRVIDLAQMMGLANAPMRMPHAPAPPPRP